MTGLIAEFQGTGPKSTGPYMDHGDRRRCQAVALKANWRPSGSWFQNRFLRSGVSYLEEGRTPVLARVGVSCRPERDRFIAEICLADEEGDQNVVNSRNISPEGMNVGNDHRMCPIREFETELNLFIAGFRASRYPSMVFRATGNET